MTSIRRALSIRLISIGLCAGLVTAALSFWAATDEAEELFDAQMAQMARLMSQLVPTRFIEPSTPLSANTTGSSAWAPAHPYEKQLSYRVLSPAGQTLILSPSFPADIDTPDIRHTAQPGYQDLELNSTHWRLFTLATPDSRYYIQVIQDGHIRRELALKIALTNTLPIFIFLPLLGLTIWWLIGRSLRPLLTIGQQVATRSSDNLEPLALEQIPDEIDDLVSALNELLERLQQSFQRERRFTADAAHELRTPLAALQVHCENLFQQLQDPVARSDCDLIKEGLGCMNRMVEQLLQLSRLDPQEHLPDIEAVNLSNLCRDMIGDQIVFAIEREIDLGLDAPEEDIFIQGNAFYLGLMLRNLIDNALRYTPAGGEVTLRLEHQEDRVQLSVIDTGTGLDPTAKERVFERFYRQNQQTTGSGLGLSIVKLITDLHSADISLKDRASGKDGLVVQVYFKQE